MYDSPNEKVITKSSTIGKKSIVLTFDDGPSRLLPQFLDVLEKENVPAVFFWQSRFLTPNSPWQRVLGNGHKIGAHTVNHPNLAEMAYEEQFEEIKQSIQTIEGITESPVRYFRPPYGRFNDDTLRAAAELNVAPVMWKVASMDWELENDPDQLIATVVDHLEDGAVILLHELRQTLEALPQLIAAIKEKGYGFTLL
ncbi:polysaccharide deacetylase family protein [Planococcus sp. YIM B11945]|uniref:polysaccharide deacetylase family protein n=1 Tax=Planococcus sp. YIM B11945 TaxID=3435410 RepID=UPI003D7D8E8D